MPAGNKKERVYKDFDFSGEYFPSSIPPDQKNTNVHISSISPPYF